MARLHTVNPDDATGKAGELLSAVKSKMGMVPNMTRVMANAPATLEGYLALSGAVGGGELSPALREKIAVFAAQRNGCEYCLSAHTAIGKSLGVSVNELTANRTGESEDARDQAALRFAQAVIETRGGVDDNELQIVRDAGFNDGEISEIVANVVLNIFTNYVNRLAQTDIDFPVVEL